MGEVLFVVSDNYITLGVSCGYLYCVFIVRTLRVQRFVDVYMTYRKNLPLFVNEINTSHHLLFTDVFSAAINSSSYAQTAYPESYFRYIP